MREAIGGNWLFQIVIIFVFIFTGYICLSINHSKAFAIKDDIILELQRNGEYSETTQKNIKSVLDKAGYRTSGTCPDGYTGYGRDARALSNGAKGAVFCLKKVSVSYSEYPDMFYYKVRVFYQLDLPVINSFTTFMVKGDTKVIAPKK